MVNDKLRREVIELHNQLFNIQLHPDETNVSKWVFFSIVEYYMRGSGSPFLAAVYAQECMDHIKDENLKLDICKRLLEGKKANIPGMRGEYRLWYIFYNPTTGEKY